MEDRDTGEAEADFEALLQPLMAEAKKLLKRRGGFLPFGSALGEDGRVTPLPRETGDPRPRPADVVGRLVAAFKQQVAAGTLRAAGIAVNIKVVPPGGSRKTDSLCVQLEHRDGTCLEVYLPYTPGIIFYGFGKKFAVHRVPRVFLAR